MLTSEMERLKKIIEESDNIVFFGGAGVSTESGIPDFRSTDGLYHQQYDYPPETILSHTFFRRKTEEFYRFYRDKMLALDAKPNAAHLKLAQWEREGKLKAVITQNIDGLHQEAGSRKVLELHGSVLRNYCEKCHKFYDVHAIADSEGVPRCECGGIIKPDVVLYEEGLDMRTMQEAISFISQADVLIIGGTSLVVYPAAGLIDYYRGNKLVLVNKTPTSRDSMADLVVAGSIGEIFFFLIKKETGMDIQVGDIVTLKKQHPCGSKEWEVLRIGADFRLKCMGCEHQIMIARKLVEKNIRNIKRNT